MKLLVLHISDIHFQETNNSIERKKEKLFDAVKNRLAEVDECLIIISGDVAYSGMEGEYTIAGG